MPANLEFARHLLQAAWAIVWSAVFALGQTDTLPAPWKTHVSKEGGFSVAFPGTPNESKQKVKSQGQTVEVRLLVVDSMEGTYVVGYSEAPDGTSKAGTEEKRLDNARDGAVQSARGKLLSEKRIAFDGYSGRELLILTDNANTLRIRIFAIRNKLYQAMAVGSRLFTASREANQFLDSFKLAK